MIQSRAVEALADAHRRDIMAAAATVRAGRRAMEGAVPARRRVHGAAMAVGRRTRGSVSQRIGRWLIDAGTRLGGATVRTS